MKKKVSSAVGGLLIWWPVPNDGLGVPLETPRLEISEAATDSQLFIGNEFIRVSAAISAARKKWGRP